MLLCNYILIHIFFLIIASCDSIYCFVSKLSMRFAFYHQIDKCSNELPHYYLMVCTLRQHTYHFRIRKYLHLFIKVFNHIACIIFSHLFLLLILHFNSFIYFIDIFIITTCASINIPILNITNIRFIYSLLLPSSLYLSLYFFCKYYHTMLLKYALVHKNLVF